MLIRLASEADLGAIDEIYNHYVARATCTYQYEPTLPAERLAWFRAHDEKHPVTVATSDGQIVGWAALSWFREREGYRFTVENTVYVRAQLHRRGIGRALLADLISRARALGHHTIIAGVSAEQAGSLALHSAFGFREVARFREVGFKFDQWLDVVFLQLVL
jgi:phosphinothricin acetyltransferase